MRATRRAWLAATVLAAACGSGADSGDGSIPADSEAARTAPSSGSVGAGRDGAASGAGPAWFEDVTASSGLDFRYVTGHADDHFMPEIMGGGAALFDMDADGDLDAYLTQGGSVHAVPTGDGAPGAASDAPANQLFAGDGSGGFKNVSAGSGAEDRGYGNGVAVGDFDNDGRPDLYVTNVGPNALLRNAGAGRFEARTAAAGVGHAGWGTSTTFLDGDRDGDLDLFVTNYLNWSVANELPCRNAQSRPDFCSPKNYETPALDVYYRNAGDGTFVDASVPTGIAGQPGTGLGVAAADFNGDGWPDLFVANDGMPDHLWQNSGDGVFANVAGLAGCAVDENGTHKAGMGVAVADVDRDGDPDLIVCNLNRESDSLYLNQGGMFIDRTSRAGLASASKGFTRFGLGWIDFDNDGFVDLYQANGRVQRQNHVFDPADPYAEPNLVFRGGPDARFEEVFPRGGVREPVALNSRAAAFGDVDGDGGVDVLVANLDGRCQLLRNVVPKRGRWLLLDVREASNRAALGAQVSVALKTADGMLTLRREVRSGYSYQAANDARVHFGLGEVEGPVTVRVVWADGVEEHFEGRALDEIHSLRRGQGAKEDD